MDSAHSFCISLAPVPDSQPTITQSIPLKLQNLVSKSSSPSKGSMLNAFVVAGISVRYSSLFSSSDWVSAVTMQITLSGQVSPEPVKPFKTGINPYLQQKSKAFLGLLVHTTKVCCLHCCMMSKIWRMVGIGTSL